MFDIDVSAIERVGNFSKPICIPTRIFKLIETNHQTKIWELKFDNIEKCKDVGLLCFRAFWRPKIQLELLYVDDGCEHRILKCDGISYDRKSVHITTDVNPLGNKVHICDGVIHDNILRIAK